MTLLSTTRGDPEYPHVGHDFHQVHQLDAFARLLFRFWHPNKTTAPRGLANKPYP